MDKKNEIKTTPLTTEEKKMCGFNPADEIAWLDITATRKGK